MLLAWPVQFAIFTIQILFTLIFFVLCGKFSCFRSGMWRPTDFSPPSFIAFSASILWSRLSPHAEGKEGESERGRSPPDFPPQKRKKDAFFRLLFRGRLRMNMRDVTCRVPREFLFCSDRQGSFVKNEKGKNRRVLWGRTFQILWKNHTFTILGETIELLPFQAFNGNKIKGKERIVLFLCLSKPPPFQTTRGVWCPPLPPVFLIPRPFRESTHFVLPYTQVQRRKRKIRLRDESLDKEFFFCFSSWGGWK